MPVSKPRPRPRQSYHHGDLRDALVRSAIELLRKEGPEALTLRGVARAAGVSQAAPYRHFADRRTLVAAVAQHGFQMLGEAMRSGMKKAEGGKGFRNVAVAYVRFAHAHPAEYRVMFGAELAKQDDLPDLARTSRSVLDFVEQAIEALQHAGIIGPGNAAAIAASIWSMLHGLVMLSLDGQLEGASLSLDQLVDETTRIMMLGMAARR